jgi:hypothetical protein
MTEARASIRESMEVMEVIEVDTLSSGPHSLTVSSPPAVLTPFLHCFLSTYILHLVLDIPALINRMAFRGGVLFWSRKWRVENIYLIFLSGGSPILKWQWPRGLCFVVCFILRFLLLSGVYGHPRKMKT